MKEVIFCTGCWNSALYSEINVRCSKASGHYHPHPFLAEGDLITLTLIFSWSDNYRVCDLVQIKANICLDLFQSFFPHAL